MKKFWQDFKQFISRGNVMDMAVGVIVGGAFGKIVTSLVSDIIMPLIGLATGGKTISDLCIVLNGEPLYIDGVKNSAALTWNYGSFLQTVIDFLIIAFCVFMMLRILIRAKKAMEDAKEDLKERFEKKEAAAEEAAPAAAEAPAAEAAPAAPDKNDQMIALLTEIKDALKARDSGAEQPAEDK